MVAPAPCLATIVTNASSLPTCSRLYFRPSSTEDEAKRTMIDMLKRPVTPEVDVLEKVSGRPPRCAESGAGESDTDIEDEKDGGCGAGDGISNGGGGGRGPSTSAVAEKVRQNMISVSIGPVCASRKHRLYSGDRHCSAY